MYWRNISSVLAGSLVAQIIPILGSIFITRIFAPSEFGNFSAWLAVVYFTSVVITLRFEAALAIVEDGIERLKAAFIVFFITTATAVILFISVILGKDFLLNYTYFSNSMTTLLTIVPAALLLALNQVCQMWAAAEGMYRKLVIMRLVQAATLIVVQIGLGLIDPNSLSLVAGFAIASVIGLGSSMAMMPKFSYIQNSSIQEFKSFFKKYRKFPLLALPADSINNAVAQLPILIVSLRFGNEVAGYLALTMRVLGAPVGLIGKAVLDVFKRNALQDIQKTGNCSNLYVKTFSMLTLASLVLIVGTIFLAEDIFRIVFGLDWIVSGQMAKWLLPMFALGMIASPLSYLTYLVEKQHIDLLWQSALMGSTLINLNLFPTYESTLIAHSIGYACMYVFYIFISYKLSKG